MSSQGYISRLNYLEIRTSDSAHDLVTKYPPNQRFVDLIFRDVGLKPSKALGFRLVTLGGGGSGFMAKFDSHSLSVLHSSSICDRPGGYLEISWGPVVGSGFALHILLRRWSRKPDPSPKLK